MGLVVNPLLGVTEGLGLMEVGGPKMTVRGRRSYILRAQEKAGYDVVVGNKCPYMRSLE